MEAGEHRTAGVRNPMVSGGFSGITDGNRIKG